MYVGSIPGRRVDSIQCRPESLGRVRDATHDAVTLLSGSEADWRTGLHRVVTPEATAGQACLDGRYGLLRVAVHSLRRRDLSRQAELAAEGNARVAETRRYVCNSTPCRQAGGSGGTSPRYTARCLYVATAELGLKKLRCFRLSLVSRKKTCVSIIFIDSITVIFFSWKL